MYPRRLVWIAVVMAASLAGCSLRGKQPPAVPPAPNTAPAAAPARSSPLSIPQTNVELPPLQPVDPRALETPPQSPLPGPEPVPPARSPRRPAAAPAAGVVPGPPPPAEGPAAQPQPPVEERPRLQEIVSTEEKRKLAEDINNRKREINEILQQASRRNLTDGERGIVERVRSFVQVADQAAARGELRKAEGLTERAVVLARELRNAR